MPMISVKNLHFSYRSANRSDTVLRGLEFEVKRGEMVAIQGSSGSGKSTLLYLLGGLLKPDSGSVVLDGCELTRMSGDELATLRNATVGFVFQQFHLLPRATVLDNILLPTRYPTETARDLPEHREKAAAIARRLGLENHLAHLPNQLSGGQQQRVAIARALMNDAPLILADEPTGNLDTTNSAQTMALLKQLNAEGKTIVIITHDPAIAAHCSRVFHMRDGVFTGTDEKGMKPAQDRLTGRPKTRPLAGIRVWNLFTQARAALPLAWSNLHRNGARSLLTMLGVTIGVASVLAMVTLGQFTKRKILESYETLGVNKVLLRGHQNWQMRAIDRAPVKFQSFSWESDLRPLKSIFPQVQLISPTADAWGVTARFGGREITNDVQAYGTNEHYLTINNRKLAAGRNISPFHLESRSAVCLIGPEVAQQLFIGVPPLGQVISMTDGSITYGCRVIGILEAQKSNNDRSKPNLQILLPYTFFALVNSYWNARIDTAIMQLDPAADIEATGKMVKAYFEQKYGKSGWFSVDSDAVLIAQMKKFLNLFTLMLTAIAIISLVVGGIGITNMMLVSVSERFKELGLRKAVGATDSSIRTQLLAESVVLCSIAGLIGIIGGFGAYELLIYGASRFATKVPFEWVIDWGALALSAVSIVVVGIASGLAPALKAERLQVIEALRSE